MADSKPLPGQRVLPFFDQPDRDTEAWLGLRPVINNREITTQLQMMIGDGTISRTKGDNRLPIIWVYALRREQ
jgi:hypothetical protein